MRAHLAALLLLAMPLAPAPAGPPEPDAFELLRNEFFSAIQEKKAERAETLALGHPRSCRDGRLIH